MKKMITSLRFILLFVICLSFYSCSTNSGHNESNKNSYSKLRSDIDLLSLGMDYHQHPDSKELAYKYINELIDERCYTMAVYLMDDMKMHIKADKEFYELYYQAALGGHLFDRILNIPPETYTQFMDDSVIFDAVSSIQKYNNLIQNGNTDDTVYRVRGEAFFKMKEYDAAEWDYRKAREKEPFSFDAFYNMLYVNYIRGKNAESLETIRENERLIEQFDSSQQRVIGIMAKVFRQLANIDNNDDLQEKEKHFEKAKVFASVKDNDIALIEINRALELDNTYGDAYAFRAYIYFHMNQAEKALDDIIQAENITGKKNSRLHKMIRAKMEQLQ